ncbi:radical SAM domain iron-sulfur cluster-binding oxidoreductase, putative [Syntrophotalea carbinolica DSM 2380]|uniref:Radical SAM domain iron-sulfur cluster-binding oxidoreductase, putative n=1 Tax=Syntrophotalea carbinolica (strain DSM 2380 / NBRC 103641 / GraBd1) TaxID=338963 RepID=Q3A7S6_SYNC1|nr:AmmeMemoRadiSam system radical SAM enzyme [Syntrophotalea carbinolica]ABA87568.1 radical SAM domain iron-sulfur cluster-binding oxidoreductase, putative [Syntrophotalea carbinolica DSM 2380]
MKEAMLYDKLPDNKVRCQVCAHQCTIGDGHLGLCQVRENRGGTLYTLVYGRTISQAVDPIEKKPLFHFYPGSLSFSIATPGCNFRCAWCQNWEISQMPREQHFIAGHPATPEQIVTEAQRSGCRSIAYTYTEPSIFFEYAHDTACQARDAGLANVFVTNGYMTAELLDTARPWLSAANVDLKAFRDATYRQHIGARLQPVLDSLKKMKTLGIWLEVTTLIIPGLNDDPAELKELAEFVSRELGADTPWHISRFFPHYKMRDLPPTPQTTLHRAEEIGRGAGLRHIYLGNVAEETDTTCPGCGTILIRRMGFSVAENIIRHDGTCPACSETIAGVGMAGNHSP